MKTFRHTTRKEQQLHGTSTVGKEFTDRALETWVMFQLRGLNIEVFTGISRPRSTVRTLVERAAKEVKDTLKRKRL